MTLIYITGAPGAGKTTLQKELGNRGYETHDLDSPEFGGPHNKKTGERVIIPPADQRQPEWFDSHEWRIYPAGTEKLKERAQNKTIFLCGVAASDGEILHLFDKILYLKMDDDTLRQRIVSRIGNDYGKNDFELQEIIERKHGLDAKYASLNTLEINATKSLSDVADEIILQTQ